MSHAGPQTAHGLAAHEGAPTIAEIVETLTLRAGFNTNTVIAGTTLLGIAAGVVGVFALLRRRALMADAISHATLPGIALAFLASGMLGASGKSLPVLLLGAALTGVLGVACVHGILRHTRLHEDAAIGVVLSVFFGVGIVGLSYIQANAPSGSAGLTRFIYGQAATMRPSDVLLTGAIASGAILGAALLLKELALVCFDSEFAAVGGWPVGILDGAMMALVVVVTVAGLQAVGLILIVAMLIIPPVAARFWTDRLATLVMLAGAFGGLSGYLGASASALLPRAPAGAVIVLTAGAVFAVSFVAAPRRGLGASAWRRLGLRLRIAGEHLLESGYEAGNRRLSPETLNAVAAERGWPAWFRGLVRAWLRWNGFVRAQPAGAMTLTEAGRQRGARVRRNHRLWEQYLIGHADIAPSHVDWSADQVEHVLSERLVAELEQALTERGVDVRHRHAAEEHTQ